MNAGLIRRIEHHLIVAPEVLEKVARGGRVYFYFVNNLGNTTTSVDRLIDLLLVFVDDQKQIVEQMRSVQQYSRGAGRKLFLDARGPCATNWHIAQIVFVIETNFQSITVRFFSIDHEI